MPFLLMPVLISVLFLSLFSSTKDSLGKKLRPVLMWRCACMSGRTQCLSWRSRAPHALPACLPGSTALRWSRLPHPTRLTVRAPPALLRAPRCWP